LGLGLAGGVVWIVVVRLSTVRPHPTLMQGAVSTPLYPARHCVACQLLFPCFALAVVVSVCVLGGGCIWES
jgi:hypothetical protein